MECFAWVQLHAIGSEVLGKDHGNLVGLAEDTAAFRRVGEISTFAAVEFVSKEGLEVCAHGDLVSSFAESYQVVVSVGDGEVGLKDEIEEGRVSKVEDVGKVDDKEDR